MSVVMCVHAVGLTPVEPPEYVKAVDVQRAGLCDDWLVLTRDLDEARRFEWLEAMALWREVVQREPERADGKPNRPLSGFTIELFDPEEETDDAERS